jgi:hypothetical protein
MKGPDVIGPARPGLRCDRSVCRGHGRSRVRLCRQLLVRASSAQHLPVGIPLGQPVSATSWLRAVHLGGVARRIHPRTHIYRRAHFQDRLLHRAQRGPRVLSRRLSGPAGRASVADLPHTQDVAEDRARPTPLVRMFGHLPDNASRWFARILEFTTPGFHVVNYVGSCAGARVFRGSRLTARKQTGSRRRCIGASTANPRRHSSGACTSRSPGARSCPGTLFRYRHTLSSSGSARWCARAACCSSPIGPLGLTCTSPRPVWGRRGGGDDAPGSRWRVPPPRRAWHPRRPRPPRAPGVRLSEGERPRPPPHPAPDVTDLLYGDDSFDYVARLPGFRQLLLRRLGQLTCVVDVFSVCGAGHGRLR